MSGLPAAQEPVSTAHRVLLCPLGKAAQGVMEGVPGWTGPDGMSVPLPGQTGPHAPWSPSSPEERAAGC